MALTNRDTRSSAKGYVQNLAMDEGMAEDYGLPHPFQFWFRPEPIRERIAVKYGKLQVLGMSHAYHLYEGTDNTPVSFELWTNRMVMLKEAMLDTDLAQKQSGNVDDQEERDGLMAELSRQINLGKKYMSAMTVPAMQALGVVGGAPPACLLVLPGVLSMRMRLISIDSSVEEVDVHGNIMELKMKVSFEEAPDRRFTMEDVLESGSNRTWGLI